jgi:pimeloyl-ACP methyl ester carboxylesterase
VLRALEAGDLRGEPILVHNGMPNSRLLFDDDVQRARRQGVRLISYDRPGYGGSTRRPGRTVADCAADVQAIASEFGIDRLAMWGFSGGGPHALACAAQLSELVTSVAVLASFAPWDAEGLDYFAGMSEAEIGGIKLTLEDPVAARAEHERDRLQMPCEMTDSLRAFLSPADAEVITDALGGFLTKAIRTGLGPGSDGWWDDSVAALNPWGFDLASIRTPVLVLHGRQDRLVPFAHGQWLARTVPGAQAQLTEYDGHFTLTANHLDDIHGWLLAHV